MATASCLLNEDQFLCSVCLDVFTDPVSTPCGHNFCKSCVTTYWDTNVQCRCPMCKKIYNRRPELQVNTFISEMAAQFRQSAQHVSKPREVPCDVCTGPELNALKSCLVCLASYCETHLEPHLTRSGLRNHQLINPVNNLEDRMCKKHDKLLELFCQTDQMCVCMMCAMLDHKTHVVVAVEEEYEGKKLKLVKTEAEIQQMIPKRRLKIEEIQQSVDLSNKAIDRELAEGDQVFTALEETVERSQAEFIQTIKEKQRTTKKQAEDFITELEQEITVLKQRSSEVKQLSQTEDQLHLLQNFSSLKTAPAKRNMKSIRIDLPSHEMIMSRAINQLEENLSKTIKTVLQDKLKKVQRFTVDVTLDPDIVHPRPDGQRKNDCRCVSSGKSFTSGSFYFEFEVGRWSRWTLGVTTQTNINGRKTLSPTNGFWTVSMKDDGRYYASSNTSCYLGLMSKPEKIGVFVDCEEGLVLFYDVDPAALIHCFTGCSFTGRIYPFFSPCPNNGSGDPYPWWCQELRLHDI